MVIGCNFNLNFQWKIYLNVSIVKKRKMLLLNIIYHNLVNFAKIILFQTHITSQPFHWSK